MDKLSQHLKAFRSETLMLLRYQLAFNRINNFNNFNNISRSDFVDKRISLKCIENDILLRICKFDDRRRGVHSFSKALHTISKNHKNYSEIKTKINLFQESIKDIKLERRHNKLAHLKFGEEDNEYEIKYNFTPVLKLIVNIIDLMNEENIKYAWSDGRYEKFDLRKIVLKE